MCVMFFRLGYFYGRVSSVTTLFPFIELTNNTVEIQGDQRICGPLSFMILVVEVL